MARLMLHGHICSVGLCPVLYVDQLSAYIYMVHAVGHCRTMADCQHAVRVFRAYHLQAMNVRLST